MDGWTVRPPKAPSCSASRRDDILEPILRAVMSRFSLAEAQACRTLDEVFRWGLSQDPRVVPHDVIVQDEYTNDAIFRAGDQTWLVFDTT